MPNENVLTAEARATIMDACQSISRSADALKDCHTVDDDWGDDLDAKAFYDAELRLLERLTALLAHPVRPEPIDMLLFCPKCGAQHVDAPEKASDDRPVLYADAWTNPPHRSHLCHACGTIWRPADVPTNGVAAIATRGKADTWSGQPVPRAEVSADDQRDGMRWRALMKNVEPAVFVERTQRRAIQRTQPVAFSSPNLTDNIGVNTTSEMWVKRYSIFAWWSRENEYRTFTEAVDAIAAGAIQ